MGKRLEYNRRIDDDTFENVPGEFMCGDTSFGPRVTWPSVHFPFERFWTSLAIGLSFTAVLPELR
jgi:hypothetical protein